MATFILPTPHPLRPPAADPLDMAGEDILFISQFEVLAGDWRTVTGPIAAEQSVRREASANVGALLRRPEWGMGVAQSIMRNLTKSLTETLVTRVRRRMLANPRVGRFIKAETIRLPTGQGIALSIEYEPAGVKQSRTIELKGER